MNKLIHQIHELSQQLIDEDIYMGGKGFYKIEGIVPFPDVKNTYFSTSMRDQEKCLLEFAASDIDHVQMQKYLRRALFLMVLEKNKNIVTALDFSIDASRAFVVLEWIAGKNLNSILKHTTLGLKESLWIVSDMCVALEHLAEFSFIHRNVTPKNITIREKTGEAYLGGVENLTLSDFLQTKLEVNNNYVSPELVQSLLYPDRQVFITPWSDIYSLGAVFFHMVTGEPPFPKKVDMGKWCLRAPLPKVKNQMLSRKERKYCQYLVDKTMHRNFLKRWSPRQLKNYVLAYLENANREKDMERWT